MIPKVTKTAFEAWWQSTNDRAQAAKNSHSAMIELIAQYRKLSSAEQEVLNNIFCEWIDSADDFKRFDALAMVEEFRITSCIHGLIRRRAQLQSSTTPDAPYELAKIDRMLQRLTHGAGRGDLSS